MKTDFLVIGSGIAGLSYALKVANKLPDTSIIIITKGDESESNTKYAQGGMAVAIDQKTDSFDQHIKDTLIAGDGICNKKVVNTVIKEGPLRLMELIKWGVNFDIRKKGELELGREGGHSVNRIIHHGDSTGLEIEKKLLNQINHHKNIKILSHHLSVDLITDHHLKTKNRKKITTCFGAYVMSIKDHKIIKIESKNTLLATGGIGQIYMHTTNPLIATGDGIAMAYRAGCKISNMEFIQFHPTAFYNPGESPSFLISEAVRGYGAILRKKNGDQFMRDYDSRKELASRDIVARAIDHELKKSGDEFVFLDCRHINKQKFKQHFPTIYKKCVRERIDIAKDMIPVVPVAHYLCGGINVSLQGKTNIKHLYACGECSNTGLHGANRLASNSLLEALVYSHHCYTSSIKNIRSAKYVRNIPSWNDKGTIQPKENIIITHLRKELQGTMCNLVGIVRSDKLLIKAHKKIFSLLNEVEELYKSSTLSPQICELRNMTQVSKLIIEQSLKRRKNKGTFYNIDLA